MDKMDLVMSDINKVEEAFSVYLKTVSKGGVGSHSQSHFTLDHFFSDRMLIISTIRAGIPYLLFESIMALTPFSEHDWAKILDVSGKTLQRYKKEKNHVFKSIHSEKILEIAEVTAAGLQVFDSKEKFYHWLSSPSFALGNMQPLDLLQDSYGKEMVLNELNRIDQGVFV